MIERAPYSYKTDPAVPAFDDSHPVLVIDGTCVLCTRGLGLILRFDKKQAFRIAPIQTNIGRELCLHYGYSPEEYDTYLLIHNGKPYARTDGYIETCKIMGGMWRIFTVAKIIPAKWRDKAYYWLDRNRIKWFGRTEYCSLLPPEKRHLVFKD